MLWEDGMTSFTRRLRGAVGIGLTWAGMWAAFAVVLMVAVGIARPGEIQAGEGAARVAAILGGVGFLSGLGFAALLFVRERRRTIHELSLGRVALWGFLGAAAIPALMGADVGEGWVAGTLGAISAACTLAAARRGALRSDGAGERSGSDLAHLEDPASGIATVEGDTLLANAGAGLEPGRRAAAEPVRVDARGT